MDNQNRTTYYYVNNQRVELIREPTIRVVKFKDPISREIPRLSSKAKTLLPNTSRTQYIPKYDLHIYKTTTTQADELTPEKLSSELSALRDLSETEENIEFISTAYRLAPESNDLLFTTKTFNVRFKPETTQEDIDNLVSRYNIKIIRMLPYAEKTYELETQEADGPNGPVAIGNIFMESGKCVWSKASFIKQLHLRNISRRRSSRKRDTRDTSYLQQQWHLEVTKTLDAWNITKGVQQITINVCDDGLDTSHPEFLGKIVGEYDFEYDIADCSHKSPSDAHGTSCAGVAAAKGIKAAGIAPNCSLMITRFPGRLNDTDEADMFFWAANNGADIISCSWGPEDRESPSAPPAPKVPLPDETREAINYCITRGRGGKGCCIVWAAGNGYGESVDDDGYASNPDVMAIGASTNPDRNGKEDKARYSDIGKAVFVCAASNGGTKAILTADRLTKTLGYNVYLSQLGGRPRHSPDPEGNYTDGFGGTSSATPLVAGIIGLMLSVNPDLTEKEVRAILMRTAEKIGDKNSYKPDSETGHSHSELYGYGRVNTLAAVKEAKKLAGPQATSVTSEIRTARNQNTMILSESLIRERDILKWLSENP